MVYLLKMVNLSMAMLVITKWYFPSNTILFRPEIGQGLDIRLGCPVARVVSGEKKSVTVHCADGAVFVAEVATGMLVDAGGCWWMVDAGGCWCFEVDFCGLLLLGASCESK